MRGIPVLAKPRTGEDLTLYLSVSEHVVSGVLVRDEGIVQTPIYYVSKTLQDVETRYSKIEKLALALVLAVKKLKTIILGTCDIGADQPSPSPSFTKSRRIWMFD